MILYIKQKVFSIGAKYNICTADEKPVYTAEGEVFTLGAKVHLYDTEARELLLIKQKLFTFMPLYEIYEGEQLFATLSKKFTFFKKKIEVSSAFGNFTIDGSFWDHDYTITCDGKLFGSVRKEWMTWGDVYELNINSDQAEHATFFVALVLAIDSILASESNSAAAGATT